MESGFPNDDFYKYVIKIGFLFFRCSDSKFEQLKSMANVDIFEINIHRGNVLFFSVVMQSIDTSWDMNQPILLWKQNGIKLRNKIHFLCW